MGTGDYPAELLAGCSGTSLHLWRVSNVNSSPPVPNSHPGQQPLEVVAWNRNNKVVAGARADGSVSLSYSNGEAMSVLNRPAGSSAIVTPTALAWASGSKRLAVAGRSGAIGVHDMTNKVGDRIACHSLVHAGFGWHIGWSVGCWRRTPTSAHWGDAAPAVPSKTRPVPFPPPARPPFPSLQACTTVHLPEPIAALQYHPADRFLAVCG